MLRAVYHTSFIYLMNHYDSQLQSVVSHGNEPRSTGSDGSVVDRAGLFSCPSLYQSPKQSWKKKQQLAPLPLRRHYHCRRRPRQREAVDAYCCVLATFALFLKKCREKGNLHLQCETHLSGAFARSNMRAGLEEPQVNAKYPFGLRELDFELGTKNPIEQSEQQQRQKFHSQCWVFYLQVSRNCGP